MTLTRANIAQDVDMTLTTANIALKSIGSHAHRWARTITLFLGALLLMAGLAKAQSAYTGGPGDGYGNSFFQFVKGGSGPFVPLSVYPSPVRQGEVITVEVDGLRNKLEILVYTLQGQLLHRNVAWNVRGAFRQRIGTEGWAAGAYLLDVRLDGRGYRYKLIVLQE